MTSREKDALVRLVNKVENFMAASTLPIAASIHAEALRGGMRDVRDELQQLLSDCELEED
jgi:hypothetical protein